MKLSSCSKQTCCKKGSEQNWKFKTRSFWEDKLSWLLEIEFGLVICKRPFVYYKELISWLSSKHQEADELLSQNLFRMQKVTPLIQALLLKLLVCLWGVCGITRDPDTLWCLWRWVIVDLFSPFPYVFFPSLVFLFVSKIHMLQFLGKLCLVMKALPLLSQNSSLSFSFAVNKDKWLCSLKAEVLCQSHHINMFSFSLALVSGKKITALLISFILLLVSNLGVMMHKQASTILSSPKLMRKT